MGEISSTSEPEGLGQELCTAVDKSRPELEKAAGSRAAQQWLKPELDTPEGTQRVYGMMEALVSKPAYLTKLEEAKLCTAGTPLNDSSGLASYPQIVFLNSDYWEAIPEERPALSSTESPLRAKEDDDDKAEAIDSYVLVEKEDVLEAIGSFVAAYLAELPQAKTMTPAELQHAIKNAFKELRKSKMQQLWGWGRAIYRCVSFSYGAFTVYENPWLVRALLTAVWTASRVMFGLLI